MRTDKELLELAAKSMQDLRDPNFANFDVHEDGSGVCLELGHRRGAITSYWHPLTDDGDALRLAVALRICLEWRRDGKGVYAGFRGEAPETCEYVVNSDDCAATRRAIVRAAAELGAQSAP